MARMVQDKAVGMRQQVEVMEGMVGIRPLVVRTAVMVQHREVVEADASVTTQVPGPEVMEQMVGSS